MAGRSLANDDAATVDQKDGAASLLPLLRRRVAAFHVFTHLVLFSHRVLHTCGFYKANLPGCCSKHPKTSAHKYKNKSNQYITYF